MSLDTEVSRLNRSMDLILAHSSLADESPMRIHSRDVDDGHGLGGPRFAGEFIRWMGQVCHCGRRGNGEDHDYGCPAIRFRETKNRNHPQRLSKALRLLRDVAPAEFDCVNLMLRHGYSWHDARARINAGREQRGLAPYSPRDFLILTIAGFDMLTKTF